MVRLLLGLAACALLLVGAYYTMKPRPAPPAPPTAEAPVTVPVSGPAAAKQVVGDFKKIEAANRAAMERTLNAAKQ